MAKLITEYVDYTNIEFLTESFENKKTYKISGLFMQANVKNRNGRIYEKALLEREIARYNKEFIQNGNSMGELDHPQSFDINLDRVSHLIEKLEMNGQDGYGVAKLLDTPCGLIAQKLLEGGVKLGVSTRGVGTLNGNKVSDNFKLLTVDIVANPSAPNAFVNGILESKEYMIKDNEIIEVAIDNLHEKYDSINRKDSKMVLKLISEFLNEVRNTINDK